MVDIQTKYDADGYHRTYITHGRHTSVIDGDFAGDAKIHTARAATPYLYGT